MLENTVFHIKMPGNKTCNASVALIPGLCALDCCNLLFLHSNGYIHSFGEHHGH